MPGELSPERLLQSTGGAIILCSLTTIIGYGTLLVAASRAIASFGLLAVFGEAACLMTAILLVPVLLAWRRPRRPILMTTRA